MSTAKVIEEFVKPKKFALAGLSRNPKHFSRVVLKSLSEKGYEIYPVNPNAEEIDGKKCFKSVEEINQDIDRLLIMTPKTQTDYVLKSAINRGMKAIWVQQGSESKDTINIAKELNYENIVTKQCIFMFSEPTGLHKFHRMINKVFGLLPK